MKAKAKYVLTRCANGKERRFNTKDTAVEFARREIARMGYGDIDEIIDWDDGKFFEIFVDVSGNRMKVYTVQLEVEFE